MDEKGEHSQDAGNAQSPSKIVASVIHEYDVIESTQSVKGAQTLSEMSQTRSCQPEVQSNSSQPAGKEKKPPVTRQISDRHRLSSSDRSSLGGEDKITAISCPKVNCPEKIIFCIDASVEMENQIFRSRAGDKLSPKHLVKKGLSMFLYSKQKLDRKHEYALMLLQNSAKWVRDFTRNPRDILLALDDVLDPPFCENCDMTSVFDEIADKVELPHIDGDPKVIPPPYCVRVILIYARSHCVLEFLNKQNYNILNLSPHFFLDALYLHEPPSDDNNCQDVFDTVCDLDVKGLSYILGASRNPAVVYNSMAQLLAHPLQRPLQSEAAYRIGSILPTPENG